MSSTRRQNPLRAPQHSDQAAPDNSQTRLALTATGRVFEKPCLASYAAKHGPWPAKRVRPANRGARFEALDMDVAAGWGRSQSKRPESAPRTPFCATRRQGSPWPPPSSAKRREVRLSVVRARLLESATPLDRLNWQRSCPTFLPRMSRKWPDRRTAYSQLTVAFGAR